MKNLSMSERRYNDFHENLETVSKSLIAIRVRKFSIQDYFKITALVRKQHNLT